MTNEKENQVAETQPEITEEETEKEVSMIIEEDVELDDNEVSM